jgi:hypothetical protein
MNKTRDIAERCLATFVECAVATIGTSSVLSLGVETWKLVLASGVAGVLSVLKGWAATRLGSGSASLAD